MGDITYEVSVSPDPREIELELLQVAHNLENVQKPLVGAARILADDTKERFETETDPEGNEWIPLDEEYLTNKLSLGYPADILHRTGAMEKAATDIAAYRVVGDSVFFDTSGLPSYATLHQTGSGDAENVGVAALHRFRSRDDEEYRRMEGGPHSSTGIGRGQALPARPFIGMSEEAEGKIWALFDLWFEESTNIYIKPSGQIQQRLSSGRFGPRVIL